MAAEDRPTTKFGDEIAQIENRSSTRRLFWIVGAVAALILAAVVVVGARERKRLQEEAARPKSEPVTLGRYLATISNQSVFARENALVYLEGIGEAEVGPTTSFVRAIEYDPQGNPIPLTGEILYWKVVSTDSVPYVIEPLANPLTGVSPSQYREIEMGALRAEDYGGGGPRDWRSMEQEGIDVQVTGLASRANGAVVLEDGPARVRVQGIEGLSALDSLEVVWATENRQALTAYGTISSTPRRSDVLFVMTAEAVHPPEPETAAAERADTTAAGADTAPAAPAAPAPPE